MLFNVYIIDMNATMLRKCIYTDVVTLVTRATSFEEIKNVLNVDLLKVQKYF